MSEASAAAAEKSLSSAADTEKSKDTSATGSKTRSDQSEESSEKEKTTDQAKVLQQDLIRLTASNFETVLKELQKMTAARNKDIAPPLAIQSGNGADNGAAEADRNRLCATAFQGLSGTVPLANAQLEKTVQNLASFLIHGSSEVAMRAATCINEARTAAEALIASAMSMQDEERNQFIARTQYLVTEHERDRQKPKLPNLDIETFSPSRRELGDGEFVVVPQLNYNRITALSW